VRSFETILLGDVQFLNNRKNMHPLDFCDFFKGMLPR